MSTTINGNPQTTTTGAVTESLAPATRLGYVHLTVTNLDRSLDFYQQVMGFQVQRQAGDTAELGAGRAPLLKLTAVPGARRVRNHSGLYHFAILTPSRLALAQSLRRLIESNVQIGGGDHLVSEAIYFSDPDGNGIEVYRDRPRTTWQYVNGQIKMDTLALDYRGILAELEGIDAPWTGLQPETVLGHMHVHVGDLESTYHFYHNVVGLDLMVNYGGSALFFAAGGYHHHLGTNTWAGAGAPPAPPDAVGLRYYTVHLDGIDERARLIARAQANGAAYEERSDGLFLRDPWGNGLLFVVER
jgi:catechol 2,3-dioxygenase